MFHVVENIAVLKVTQGHSDLHRSVGRVQVSISISL